MEDVQQREAHSSDGSLEADCAEMQALARKCTRTAVRQRLEMWVDRASLSAEKKAGSAHLAGLHQCHTENAAELEGNREEFKKLLANCQRSQVAEKLRGRVSALSEQIQQVAKKATDDGLPTVVVAGENSTGMRRLIDALTDATDGPDRADAVVAQAHLETKYYRALVHYRIIDITSDEMTANAKTYIRNAEGIVLLWDAGQPKAFNRLCDFWHTVSNSEGESQSSMRDLLDERDCVQLCVAAEGLQEKGDMGTVNTDDTSAITWCIDNGFEHLHCPMHAADLEVVRQNVQNAKRGIFSRLLDEDNEDSAVRIIEALQSHRWPGMELKDPECAKEPVRMDADADLDGAQASQTSSDRQPLVSILGAPSVGKRRLLQAMSGADAASQSIEAEMETKYYTVKLKFHIIDALDGEGDQGGAVSLLEESSGVLLLWDSSRPETLATATRVYERAEIQKMRECGVKLCIEVLTTETSESKSTPSLPVLDWCAEHGFEHLRCPFQEADLVAVQRRWQNQQTTGISLLTGDENMDSAERIVEALECHAWPGLVLKSTAESTKAKKHDKFKEAPGNDHPTSHKTDEANLGPAEKIEKEAPTKPEKGGKSTQSQKQDPAQMMDCLAHEMREVRNIKDDAERRERAAEVAMRLAESLGIDDSDDD